MIKGGFTALGAVCTMRPKEFLDRRFQDILDYYGIRNDWRPMSARSFVVGGYLFEGGDEPWSRAKTYIRKNTEGFGSKPRMESHGKGK
jgi:hypothetical protein